MADLQYVLNVCAAATKDAEVLHGKNIKS